MATQDQLHQAQQVSPALNHFATAPMISQLRRWFKASGYPSSTLVNCYGYSDAVADSALVSNDATDIYPMSTAKSTSNWNLTFTLFLSAQSY